MKDIKDASMFLKGQRDCQEGLPARQGMPEDYNRGYAAQYQHEQNMEALTRGH